MQHVDDFAVLVQKNDIYWKAHKESVNAVAWQNVQGAACRQVARAHESSQAFGKTFRFCDFLCHNAVTCFIDGA